MKPTLVTFSKAQLTAAAATIVDYSTLTGLVELCGIHYTVATAVGAALGAVTNFVANRHWAFHHEHHAPVAAEALRYGLVSAGSLVLNVAGVFCFTEMGGLRYFISKVITSILVAVLWNYPLHSRYVFKKVK